MNSKKETAKDALSRYENAVKELINSNPEEKDEIEASLALLLKDEWKMSDEEIKKEEERLGIVYPPDIVKFKKEVGSFQIGLEENDEYGDDNTPLIEFVPLLEWWAWYTDVDEALNGAEESNESLKKRLSSYINFFSEGDDVDSIYYCLDVASYNKETHEMNIEQFHQDEWWHLATAKIKICEETGVFDKFISEFIDEKISELED